MAKWINPAIIIATVLLLLGCRSSLHIEKRRYQPGFFVSLVKPAPRIAHKDRTSPISRPPAQVTVVTSRNYEQQPLALTADPHPTAPANESLAEVQSEQTSGDREMESLKEVVKEGTVGANGNAMKVQNLRTNRKYSDHVFLGSIGSVFLSIGWFFRKKLKASNRIMRWASENPLKTRRLLLISKFILGGLGALLGHYLAEAEVLFSSVGTYALLAAGAIAGLFYGTRKKTDPVKYIQSQKAGSLMIGLLSFGLVVNIANRAHHDPTLPEPYRQVTTLGIEGPASTLADANPGKGEDVYETGEIVLNIFLSLLVTLLAAVIIAAAAVISCGLSCQGQEGAALLVAGLGLALAAAIAVFLSILIWKPRNRETRPA